MLFFCFIGTVGDTLRSWRDCYTRGKVFAADSRRSLPNISRLCRKKKNNSNNNPTAGGYTDQVGGKKSAADFFKTKPTTFLNRFLNPEKFQNHSNEGKGKEKKKERGEGKEEKKKTSNGCTLSFYNHYLGDSFGQNTVGRKKVHLAITFSKIWPIFIATKGRLKIISDGMYNAC